jgi:hypothetical protein
MNGFEWNGNQMYIFDKCERFVKWTYIKSNELRNEQLLIKTKKSLNKNLIGTDYKTFEHKIKKGI